MTPSNSDSAPNRSLADDLELALAIAAEADLISMDRYLAADLDVSLKADRTHVTDADRRIEQLIRERLAAARPGDAILGEEFGGELSAARQWIIDPIDGTANFMRGVPVWGTLLALTINGVPEVGVVSAPALGRRWFAATGGGAWLEATGAPRGAAGRERRSIRVSEVGELGEASLSYNSLKGWDDERLLLQLIALSRQLWRTRAYGDLWSYMLVAEGAVDLAGEPDLKPWDIAALVPIVREAGGTATDFDGGDPLSDSGTLLVSNGRLHAAALEALAR